MKYLADDQDVQSRLHDDLKTAFSRSADVHFSSTKEIVQADIPYLDAVVHEILRCARVTPVILREAMQDTQILGYNIPKGTSVLCSLQQDSFLGDDTLEPVEPSAQGEHRALGKTWQRKDRRKFDPSRWLTSVSGKEIFDPNAGPSLPFSAGTRGCFGLFNLLICVNAMLTILQGRGWLSLSFGWLLRYSCGISISLLCRRH